MRIQATAAAAGLLLLGAASGASAATSTANLNVSITLTAGCSVNVTNINFGSLAATALTAAQTSSAAQGGLLTYTCSPGARPALTAGQGGNFATTNRMRGAANGGFLPYTLTLPTLAATVTGAAQTAQITATIPAQTTLPFADTYSDTVVLTLTY